MTPETRSQPYPLGHWQFSKPAPSVCPNSPPSDLLPDKVVLESFPPCATYLGHVPGPFNDVLESV